MRLLGDDGAFARPVILETVGETASTAVPGVEIEWQPVFARLAPPAP